MSELSQSSQSVNLADPKIYSLIDEDVRIIDVKSNDATTTMMTQSSVASPSPSNLSSVIPSKLNKDNITDLDKQKYKKEKKRLRIILICFCLVLILCIFLTIRRWMLAYKLCGQKNNKLDCVASLSPEVSALGFAAVSLL
jgi:hypothetical protein